MPMSRHRPSGGSSYVVTLGWHIVVRVWGCVDVALSPKALNPKPGVAKT